MKTQKTKPTAGKLKRASNTRSPLFILLVGIPFCIFLLSAMFGSLLKQDRISSESAFESRMNPIERAWRGLKLKVYAYEYGPDYRNKIPENEGRALGVFRESLLESLLPRYLFLFLAFAFPFYFFVRLLKDKPHEKRSKWPGSSSPTISNKTSKPSSKKKPQFENKLLR